MMYLFIVLFLSISSIILPQQKNSMDEIKDLIKNAGQKYAPDKRTAIFDVDIKPDKDKFILMGQTNMKKAKENLINRLKTKNINFEDHIELLPSKKLGKKIFALINLSVANIRTKPEHSAELASQALLGTFVKVLNKTKNSWYQIQTPDDYIAWVDAGGIQLMDDVEIQAWDKAGKIIFTNTYGMAYVNPDETSTPVSDLVAGDILKKVEDDGEFVKVEYPDKRIGFVKTKSVVDYNAWLKSLQINSFNIIAKAKELMGVPYLWGGTSIKGVDCSGFTKTVFFLNGVLLPRDASQQVNIGEPVDTKNGFDKLQPGDLLFFGKKATDTSKEKVTHVGIYIGNGEFIHSAGRVKINSLDKGKPNFSEYRYNQFIRAKRILTSLNKNGVKAVQEK